ncbi:MAG: hypothetical protein ABI164_10075 [Acidobacteriaceae bacterium]
MNDDAMLSGSPQRNKYGPLTPGEMFERTFALLREHAGLFFGIVLVVIGIEIAIGVVLGGSGVWMGRYGTQAAPVAKALFFIPVALLGAALIYIVTQIIQGALFLATRATLVHAPMSIGEACREAAEQTGRLVGISILVALRIIGYMLLLNIAAGVLVLIALAASGMRHSFSQNPFHAGHGAVLGVEIFVAVFLLAVALLYVVVFFWLILRYAVAIPACLEENLRVTDAIRRSISLSRGSKGRLVALFLAICCAWIAMACITVPLQLMATHTGHSALILLAAAIRIGFSWIVIAFLGVATTLCYFDLRVRKDGFGAQPVVPVLGAPSGLDIPPAGATPPLLTDGPIEDLPVS